MAARAKGEGGRQEDRRAHEIGGVFPGEGQAQVKDGAAKYFRQNQCRDANNQARRQVGREPGQPIDEIENARHERSGGPVTPARPRRRRHPVATRPRSAADVFQIAFDNGLGLRPNGFDVIALHRFGQGLHLANHRRRHDAHGHPLGV